MKLTMARGELLESLSVASRGLSSRSTLPILSGIFVSAAESGDVTFQATDLEISIRHTATALVERPGTPVLPGKLLSDIIRSLPESAVTIDVANDTASIVCGQASFTVKTLSPDDFPRFPEVEADKTVSIPTEVFSDLVSHVSKATSRDETRPVLTGILLVVEGHSVRMVATDSYRLSVKEVMLTESLGEDTEVVIPGKALEEAVRMAAGRPKVELGVSDNQVVFDFETTTFVTRRIEGSFPNYRQLLPKEYETTVTVSKEEFSSAVKRVALLAQHNTPLRLSVSSEDQTLSLSATTQDVGDASEDLMAKVEGGDVEIAFNHGFLADGISCAGGDMMTINIVSSLKPGVLTAAQDEGFLYLLMPVRLG